MMKCRAEVRAIYCLIFTLVLPGGGYCAGWETGTGFRTTALTLPNMGKTGFVQLQYDATSSPYKSAANVNFANSNTWKVAQWHVTDAYFGNRQNGGADYRIARGQSTTWYLDTVQTSMSQP
jgi:hypothetical protein